MINEILISCYALLQSVFLNKHIDGEKFALKSVCCTTVDKVGLLDYVGPTQDVKKTQTDKQITFITAVVLSADS